LDAETDLEVIYRKVTTSTTYTVPINKNLLVKYLYESSNNNQYLVVDGQNIVFIGGNITIIKPMLFGPGSVLRASSYDGIRMFGILLPSST